MKDNISAKEMFEKLGYKQLGSFLPDSDYIIIAYKKEFDDEQQYVYFGGNKLIWAYTETKKGRVSPAIFDLKELQAINQQIKELDWYEN